MSRKVSLLFTIALVVGMALYMGRDGAMSVAEIPDSISFLSRYLDNVQKYLYISSLFLLPAIYTARVPFLEPVYLQRLKGRLFLYVFQKALAATVLLSALIMGSYILSALLFGIPFVFTPTYGWVFLRLFLFVFAGFCLYNLLYFFTGKTVLCILCVLVCNLFLLGLLIGVNYYMLGSRMSQEQQLTVQLGCNLAVIVAAIGVFLFKGEDKECLA